MSRHQMLPLERRFGVAIQIYLARLAIIAGVLMIAGGFLTAAYLGILGEILVGMAIGVVWLLVSNRAVSIGGYTSSLDIGVAPAILRRLLRALLVLPQVALHLASFLFCTAMGWI